MKTLPVNFVAGLTTDNPLAVGATTFNSPGLASLPEVTTVSAWICFNPDGAGTAPEIALVTAHAPAATSATIVRGQQGTTDTEWDSGTTWTCVFTASDVDDIYERAAVAGDIKSGIWASVPTGWLFIDGTTHVNADVNFPDLWAVAPATWKSGSDLVLPDMGESRVLMGGGTLGAEGGSNTHNLTTANLPAHSHSMAHTHGMAHTHPIDHQHSPATTSVNGGHSHTVNNHTHTINHDHPNHNTSSGGAHLHDGRFLNVHNPGPGGGAAPFGAFVNSASPFSGTANLQAGGGADGEHGTAVNLPNFTGSSGGASPNTNFEPSHDHTVNVPAFSGNSGAASTSNTGASSAANTGNTGSGTAVNHTPAHVRVNWAVKF